MRTGSPAGGAEAAADTDADDDLAVGAASMGFCSQIVEKSFVN